MKEKRHIKGYIITAATSVVLTAVIIMAALNIDPTRLMSQIPLIRKLTQIDMYAGHNYVDDYDSSKAADNAADGYVSTFDDDYADYFSVDEQLKNEQETAGEKLGIGMSIAVNPDTNEITVVGVSRNGPAKKAGILTGDVITEYNGTSANGKTVTDVANAVAGESGKQSKLTVSRSGKSLTFELKCSDFINDSVTWRKYKNYGIIAISTFDNTTKSQFDEAIKSFENEDIKGYIIDLRNNLGGTVDSCTAILDELLPKGDTCRVKYHNGKISVLATSDEKYIELPLCLIVNEKSASASEIFATAIRDFGRGKIVGTKTYGKGIMQTTYTLSDKSAVKFTVAKVVDKNGDSYHKKGIEPDITVSLTDEQLKHFYFMDDDNDPQMTAALTQLNAKSK